MILTGKCKEDFEKWFHLNDEYLGYEFSVHKCDSTPDFYKEPFSMQYGVLVDFFDSVGIFVDAQADAFDYGKFWYSVLDKDHSYGEPNADYITRTEARQKAIEKAVEIYNQQ
jgi:hypothetical protein